MQVRAIMTKAQLKSASELYYLLGFVSLFLLAVVLAHGILSPRGLYLDFANFYDAGKKAAAGETENLYDEFAMISGKAPYGHMRFFGTPISAYAYAPLAAFPPVVAAILFKIFSTLCILVGLFLLYRRFGAFVAEEDRPGFFFFFCAAALLFQPFWTVLQVGGQSSSVAFLLFLIGLLWYERGSDVAAAIALSVVVCLKPAFASAAIAMFLMSTHKFRAGLLVSGVIGLGISLALMGWDIHQQFLGMVLSEGSSAPERWNSSALAWLAPIFYSDGDPEIYFKVRLIASLALVTLWLSTAFFTRKRRQNDAAARYFIFLICGMVALSLSPIVWSHYLMILFIPVAQTIAFRRQMPRGAVILVLLAVLAATIQNLLVVNQFWKLSFASEAWFSFAMSLFRSLTMMFVTAALLIYARSFQISCRTVSSCS